MSAGQGNIYGIANYAMALLNGTGVEKNFQKTEEYLKKSADLDYYDAQFNYGCLILDNNPTVSKVKTIKIKNKSKSSDDSFRDDE